MATRGQRPSISYQSNGRPEDAHGEEIVVGMPLVELLHHDGDDNATNVAPDSLECDHTPPDSVWADLNHVDSAGDSDMP